MGRWATGCQSRLVLEWLHAQVASAYWEHDAGRFWLTPEQAACLADPTSPTFVAGEAFAATSTHNDTDRVRQAFTGDGGSRTTRVVSGGSATTSGSDAATRP
jgi:hypothetical protein